MRTRLQTAIVMLTLVMSFVARARATDADLVAPYVGDRTAAVVRIDLEKVSLTKVARWYIDSMKRANAPADLMLEMENQIKMGSAMAQQQVDKVKQMGVKQVLLVVNLDDRDQPHPILVVPGVTNMDQLKQMVQPMGLSIIKSEGDLIATDRGYAGAIAGIKPARRDDLTAPLANADSAIMLSAALPESLRAKLAVDHPTIQTPDDEIDTQMLLDGLRHVLVKIDMQPAIGMGYTIQSKDEAAAKALKEFADTSAVREIDKDKSMAGLLDVVKLVSPTRQGDTLSLSMKEADLDKLIATSLPAMLKARETANRVKSASNIRQMMLAVTMFANDNKGQTPATFQDLEKYLGGPMQMNRLLSNPLHPELAQAGYVFVPAPEGRISKIKDSSGRLAIYDAGDFGDGVNVGFWDGHVQWIADKAKFDQLLATAQGK